MTERVGYQPGLSLDEIAWTDLHFGGEDQLLEISAPVLTDAQLAALAKRVRAESRKHLNPMPVAQIVDIVDRAVTRLLDRNNPLRQKAEKLLPTVTGYDSEMIRLGLTGYLKTFRKPELQKFIAEDFPNPLILDDFQPVPKGGAARAFGPGILTHIWAGNVPGLPVWSFISGLLVKAGNIGKVASAEPLFAGWFAQTVAEVAPEIADCFAVVWWKGGDTAREKSLLRESDVVLAYGSNTSLAAIRDRVPVSTRYLSYGHKISFGMISRTSLDIQKAATAAHLAAYDVIRYDQQGCYSPHLFFVERAGRVTPEDFAHLLAHELDTFEKKYPRRPLSIAEAREVAAWRHTEEIKSFSGNSGGLIGNPESAWSVAYVEKAEDLSPSGLNRTVKVVAVDALSDVIALVAPYKMFLQTVGIAAAPDVLYTLSAALGRVGVTRVSALGHMTTPEAGWHHDGRFNLLDLVTITEIERSAEIAADTIAPYTD